MSTIEIIGIVIAVVILYALAILAIDKIATKYFGQ